MNTIINILLPYVFNSREAAGSARTPNSSEYSTSYGKFKPVYLVSFRPPRNDEEAQRLYNHIRTAAWYLDAIPFLSQSGLPFRIGVDDIISAIPVFGDFIGVILAMYQVFLSWLFGVPLAVLGRMVINVVIDLVLGITPILGDILDALFKSNLRNLALLEEWLLTGSHEFSIQVTPSDEFLPKKSAYSKGSGGFAGLFSRGNNGTSVKTGADAGDKSVPQKGTRRFKRADLAQEDLD